MQLNVEGAKKAGMTSFLFINGKIDEIHEEAKALVLQLCI
jgi:hypothetical protein